MDLVFEVNSTRKQVFGHFCALDDSPSIIACRRPGERIAQFGIRFYAWSAICFSDSRFRIRARIRTASAPISGRSFAC
ncbi:MAG: hypothetical protein SOR74_01690 [Candidatus Faecivicinus sp.]|nr:hypothetical protein [Candidatus Faecivicinus sp.]